MLLFGWKGALFDVSLKSGPARLATCLIRGFGSSSRSMLFGIVIQPPTTHSFHSAKGEDLLQYYYDYPQRCQACRWQYHGLQGKNRYSDRHWEESVVTESQGRSSILSLCHFGMLFHKGEKGQNSNSSVENSTLPYGNSMINAHAYTYHLQEDSSSTYLYSHSSIPSMVIVSIRMP
jgi:hypothetical protein